MKVKGRRAACVLALVAVLAAALNAPLVVPATADEEAFVGSGLARALHLNVLNQGQETMGSSEGRIESTPKATAKGFGSLTLFEQSGSEAAADSPGDTERDPEDGSRCAVPVIDVPDPVALTLGTVCSSAEAKVSTAGEPSYNANASVASLDLNASTLISTLTTPLEPALEPVFGALPAELQTLEDLVNELQATKTLAVRLGDSASTALETGDTVAVKSDAKAGHIDILPNGETLPYLIRIVIGSAAAAATHNSNDGTGEASFDPAIVTLKFAPLLGQQIPDVTVAPGQTVDLPLPAPLQSTITVANGSTFEHADGSIGAVADGVRIHLFKGLLETSAGAADGGIRLELAHAEASVVGSPITVEKSADPTAVRVNTDFTTTITVNNPHECPLQNVKVTDTITVEDDARFRYVSSDPEADTVPSGNKLSNGTVVWNDIGDIAPGESKSVRVKLRAQGGNGKIVDVAQVNGFFGDCPGSDEEQGEVEASTLADVPVTAEATLEVPTALEELPRTGPVSAGSSVAGLALAALGFAFLRRRSS